MGNPQIRDISVAVCTCKCESKPRLLPTVEHHFLGYCDSAVVHMRLGHTRHGSPRDSFVFFAAIVLALAPGGVAAKPELQIVKLVSDNNDNTLAKAGDTVTLNMVSKNNTLLKQPTCEFKADGTTVKGSVSYVKKQATGDNGKEWDCKFTVDNADKEKQADFAFLSLPKSYRIFRNCFLRSSRSSQIN